MKYINKVLIFLGLIGCITGLVLCAYNHIDFGTWDIPAFIVGIIFFGLMTMWRPILVFLDDRFDIEYTKDKGLTVKETKKKK